jgi:hypothetical protein
MAQPKLNETESIIQNKVNNIRLNNKYAKWVNTNHIPIFFLDTPEI